MHKLTARVQDDTVSWLAKHFETKTSGAEFALDLFPLLISRTWRELRGKFTRGELCLILDVFNGVILSARLSGQHLLLEVYDGMTIEGLDAKWEVDRDLLMGKLKALSGLELTAMEIWGAGFWHSGTWEDQEHGIETWCRMLQ